jgi:exoribonuclease R
MDIFIENDVTIAKIEFSNAFIKVYKNYTYEEPCLLMDKNYSNLLHSVKNFSHLYPSFNDFHNNDSHELVSFLMILMNYHCASKLVQSQQHSNKGIFRTTVASSNIPTIFPKFLSGTYVEKTNSLTHAALGLNAYIHITSPIRRIVDLLNMIVFQMDFFELSEKAHSFYNKWAADLNYINVSMRSIKKIQSDCELLHMCMNNPSLLTTTFDGNLLELLEPIERNNNNNNNNLLCYRVYLPTLKLFSQTYVPKEQKIDSFIYSLQKFKLFLFNDEEHFRKKIRIILLI